MSDAAAKSNLFETVAPGRECGDCVACCYVLAIEALKKPAGIMCRHCTGTGCGAYDTRPAACSAFFCLWRRVAALPDELRPKDCGVMFSLQYGKPGANVLESMYIVAGAISDPKALDNPLVKGAIDMFAAQSGLPVYVAFRGTMYRVAPKDDLADAILNPDTTVHTHLAEQAAEWRKRRGV